ncbi:MAG: sugar phosphate isomerase/epimerase [Steroidobacteraceae bacterium]
MRPWSRRQILIRSARLGAAALASRWEWASARATPPVRPAGIQLYTVRAELEKDPAATLHAIKAIGFDEVETAGFAGLPVQEFRQLLDDAGLKCPSAHLLFDLANLGPAFEAAHALGAHYATSGGLRGSLRPPLATHGFAMTLEEAKRTADLANHLGEQARRSGLQFAYHNHNGEFVDQGGAIGFDLLLRETDPQLVEFEIDCGWMVVGGRSPVDYFIKYPHRFPMIHVKDFLPPANPTDRAEAAGYAGAELGHGMIDYRPILAVAAKAGVRHYFAEQEGPFLRMTPLDAARQAYAYLHSVP